MKKIVAGNWKMHGDAAMALPLLEAVAEVAAMRASGIQVVVCPPATLLTQAVTWLIGSAVKVGGQDCHSEDSGAFTGDISADMLREAGCAYVIVGHSERRQGHHESSVLVAKKADRAIQAGLTPIICIGETGAERNAGKTEEVVERQVLESLPDSANPRNFVLAYEPVWAIGSGQTPTLSDIRTMHRYIMAAAARRVGAEAEPIAVLYGGSVKSANAKDIMAIEGVAGVLVGGASLKADEFCEIIGAA